VNAMRFALVAIALSGILPPPGTAAGEEDPTDLRASAWSRSLALEEKGELVRAREILWRAWGPEPEPYEVAVRLAWLSLRVGRAQEAVDLYRRAMALEGAGPEARQGLARALALQGFEELKRGNRDSARRLWQEALRQDGALAEARRGLDLIEPAWGIAPEMWFGYLRNSANGASAQGLVAYLQIPAQLSDRWRLRAAFRHVEPIASEQGRAQGSSGQNAVASWRQEEIHFGVGFEHRWLGAQILALSIFPASAPSIFGPAGSLRLGRRLGLEIQTAALGDSSGWNTQLVPAAFLWPLHSFGISAGARLTWSPLGQSTSGLVGVTALLAPVSLFLQAHYGVERWPVTLAGPTVLSLPSDAAYGGTLTMAIALHRELRLYLQAQLERLEAPAGNGMYLSAAVGLQWSPRLGKE
jgi:tetratricopeptide (TPR) repeat protein